MIRTRSVPLDPQNPFHYLKHRMVTHLGFADATAKALAVLIAEARSDNSEPIQQAIDALIEQLPPDIQAKLLHPLEEAKQAAHSNKKKTTRKKTSKKQPAADATSTPNPPTVVPPTE